MFQTSKEYKESMKRPIRNESYMKIQLGLINQEAQQSAELENTDYTTFSDSKSLFRQHTVKRYATYEQNMFKADGSMYFLPENAEEYWLDGYTCNDLFSGEMHIKFDFGCGKSDIKGLTIKFGECYPTNFSVVTDDGTSVDFKNNKQIFKTDTVFDNTAYIELIITEMSVPNNRVRIDYIQFGLGLEYDNEWILEASSKTTISSINDDLPESEFDITLHNDNQLFNVDNPASEINFLESGQRLNVTVDTTKFLKSGITYAFVVAVNSNLNSGTYAQEITCKLNDVLIGKNGNYYTLTSIFSGKCSKGDRIHITSYKNGGNWSGWCTRCIFIPLS